MAPQSRNSPSYCTQPEFQQNSPSLLWNYCDEYKLRLLLRFFLPIILLRLSQEFLHTNFHHSHHYWLANVTIFFQNILLFTMAKFSILTLFIFLLIQIFTYIAPKYVGPVLRALDSYLACKWDQIFLISFKSFCWNFFCALPLVYRYHSARYSHKYLKISSLSSCIHPLQLFSSSLIITFSLYS